MSAGVSDEICIFMWTFHWIDRLSRADAARAILESGNFRDSRSAAGR